MRWSALHRAQPYVLSAFFIAAGTLHFVRPRIYEAIVPPFLPAHREVVLISGGFEILGGAGLLVSGARPLAAWGLIALLVAVFPANLYMAFAANTFSGVAPAYALYARLPLQFVLAWWIYATCIGRDRRQP